MYFEQADMPSSDEESRTAIILACRVLAAHGCGSAIGGHVSIRRPGSPSYWTTALDRALIEMEESDLAHVDFDGVMLEGSRPVSPGIGFHGDIYRRREDVTSIVHSHGFWISALAAIGRPPRVMNNAAAHFHDSCAISPDDAIASIGPAIGTSSTLIIPHHGAITVGVSLGVAVALHLLLEAAARLDVTLAATDAVPIDDGQCEAIRRLMESGDHLRHTWELAVRRILATSAGPDGPASTTELHAQ